MHKRATMLPRVVSGGPSVSPASVSSSAAVEGAWLVRFVPFLLPVVVPFLLFLLGGVLLLLHWSIKNFLVAVFLHFQYHRHCYHRR